MPSLINEHTQYIDPTTSLPLVSGKLYVGTQNMDPVANMITIYSDRALATPITNPQTLDSSGRTTNKIWVPGPYSLQVDTSADVQKHQELDAGSVDQTGITTLTNVQGTNTITAEGSPTAVTSLTDGQQYNFKAANANTGAVTLQIDLTTAKSVLKRHDIALVSGDIEQNQVISVVYNSTDDVFELVSNIATESNAPISTTIQASTSGTVIDFTSLPSWVKWIDVMFEDVSTSGIDPKFIQIGDSGGFETSAYSSQSWEINTTSTTRSSSSGGFIIGSVLAADTLLGSVRLTLLDSATNHWMCNGMVHASAVAMYTTMGDKALSGVLTQIRITTASGTDTFDAGNINILYG